MVKKSRHLVSQEKEPPLMVGWPGNGVKLLQNRTLRRKSCRGEKTGLLARGGKPFEYPQSFPRA